MSNNMSLINQMYNLQYVFKPFQNTEKYYNTNVTSRADLVKIEAVCKPFLQDHFNCYVAR